MTEEERKFAIKVNVDKAKNKMKIPIALIIISILTYAIPLMEGDFDFGIVFEIISFAFLIVARFYMEKYDETRIKRYIICAMIPVGWLLIYDFIVMISSASSAMESIVAGFGYGLYEILSIGYMIVLFLINKDLAKADNPEKYKESTDWFYEKYEQEDDKNKNI